MFSISKLKKKIHRIIFKDVGNAFEKNQNPFIIITLSEQEWKGNSLGVGIC